MIHYFQIINSTKQKSGKEQVTLSLHKKMKFFIKVSSVNMTKSAGNWIWSYLLKKSLMGNFFV